MSGSHAFIQTDFNPYSFQVFQHERNLQWVCCKWLGNLKFEVYDIEKMIWNQKEEIWNRKNEIWKRKDEMKTEFLPQWKHNI